MQKDKNTKRAPLVSVIIATYNYAQYIEHAIESIVQQHDVSQQVEIIVVDDGSTDNTKQLLAHYVNDGIIKYVYQENQGKAAATIRGIGESNGKYIFNLDADDYFLAGKIARTVEVFEEDESIVHVASPARFFSEEKNTTAGTEDVPSKIVATKINGLDLLKYFYENNIVYGGGSTFAARSSVLKKINIPVEVDMYIDEFLLLTVLPLGKSYFIQEPLSVWRIHKNNYSCSFNNLEEKLAKSSRLLPASNAVKKYLEQNKFDQKICNIYRLKDLNRNIAFKETVGTKKLKDILSYAREVFFNIRPDWKMVKKYQVLNRLLPLSIYTLLKKIIVV
ncbi:MAG TPA: glycosyltransferase [Chitinophagaceae bacterium]|nr:glycosyltransferase [Chitinophagaceae bacterium]